MKGKVTVACSILLVLLANVWFDAWYIYHEFEWPLWIKRASDWTLWIVSVSEFIGIWAFCMNRYLIGDEKETK